jgi:hypothetical protein
MPRRIDGNTLQFLHPSHYSSVSIEKLESLSAAIGLADQELTEHS